jgi:phage terminase large subunit GpA-like protein
VGKTCRHKRNEALDCRNYANAAFEILNPDLDEMACKNINGNIFIQSPKSIKKKRRVISKGI